MHIFETMAKSLAKATLLPLNQHINNRAYLRDSLEKVI